MAIKDLPKHPIEINAYEAGMLMTIIWDHPHKTDLMAVLNQLLVLKQKFDDEAGTEKTLLPDGKVQFKDKHGNVIIRDLYGWEK